MRVLCFHERAISGITANWESSNNSCYSNSLVMGAECLPLQNLFGKTVSVQHMTYHTRKRKPGSGEHRTEKKMQCTVLKINPLMD